MSRLLPPTVCLSNAQPCLTWWRKSVQLKAAGHKHSTEQRKPAVYFRWLMLKTALMLRSRISALYSSVTAISLIRERVEIVTLFSYTIFYVLSSRSCHILIFSVTCNTWGERLYFISLFFVDITSLFLWPTVCHVFVNLIQKFFFFSVKSSSVIGGFVEIGQWQSRFLKDVN